MTIAAPHSSSTRRDFGTAPSRVPRALLPVLSLALIVLAIFYFNPRAISYLGFTLMLNLAVPVALATIACSASSASKPLMPFR